LRFSPKTGQDAPYDGKFKSPDFLKRATAPVQEKKDGAPFAGSALLPDGGTFLNDAGRIFQTVQKPCFVFIRHLSR